MKGQSSSPVPSPDPSRSWAKRGLRLALLPIIWITALALLRLRHRNRQNIPKTGPILLAANHVCWVDPVVVYLASPRPVRFLVVQGFYRKPLVRFFALLCDAIPIRKDQPRAALMAAVAALRQGDVVCIFPEGILTRDGSFNEVRRGFALIAQKAACPVLPVTISGLHGTALGIRREWNAENLWKAPWPNVLVTFGTPIPGDEVTPESITAQWTSTIGHK